MFRVSNLVLHNVGKRSQCQCVRILNNRTQNVDDDVHILLLLLWTLNFGRPPKKMTFTYATAVRKPTK